MGLVPGCPECQLSNQSLLRFHVQIGEVSYRFCLHRWRQAYHLASNSVNLYKNCSRQEGFHSIYLSTICLFIHEFHVMLCPKQQNVGNKINSKVSDGWEWDFLPGNVNTPHLSPCKSNFPLDLNLGGYRDSKFKNPPFYLHVICEICLWAVKCSRVSFCSSRREIAHHC